MPGHNAFQRNAFQRNAFQIVYEFEPTIDGGLVLGGNVTTRFTHHYAPTVSGGLVLGGAVRCSFHSGVVPPPVRRMGTPGRVWRNIFARPRKRRVKVSGGIVLGGGVRAYFHSLPPVGPEIVAVAYLAQVDGGLVIGGAVEAQFITMPPEPLVEIPETISQPLPDPVSYKASPHGGGVGIEGGIRARFQSNPPPPEPSTRVWTFFNRHKAQQLEEDELLLMDIL